MLSFPFSVALFLLTLIHFVISVKPFTGASSATSAPYCKVVTPLNQGLHLDRVVNKFAEQGFFSFQGIFQPFSLPSCSETRLFRSIVRPGLQLSSLLQGCCPLNQGLHLGHVVNKFPKQGFFLFQGISRPFSLPSCSETRFGRPIDFWFSVHEISSSSYSQAPYLCSLCLLRAAGR